MIQIKSPHFGEIIITGENGDYEEKSVNKILL